MIQSYSVYFGPFNPYWLYSVHFSPFGPFCPLWSYSIYFLCFGSIGPIPSILYTLIQLSPIRAIRSNLVLFSSFCPLSFYTAHSIDFGPIQSILVLFGPIYPLWSDLVLFSPFSPPCSYSVLFCPFGPLCVPFGTIGSIWITLVHSGPLRSIFFVHLHNEKWYVWVEST